MMTGYVGTLLTLGATAAVLGFHASLAVRSLVFAPAVLTTFGFFQAQQNTCVAFALQGIKVLGDSRKDAVKVDAGERDVIKAQANKVYVRAIGSALVYTALVMVVPL